LQHKKTLVSLVLLASTILPATAHASSDATSGKLTTTVTESASPVTDTDSRLTFTHHKVTITVTRSGLFGGRLWDFSHHMEWDTRLGWVFHTKISRSAHGSLTWANDGSRGTDHWGCESQTDLSPLCTYEGWATTWHFSSNIHDPILGVITENNYPRITSTAWGKRQSNGHFYTYTRKCGC